MKKESNSEKKKKENLITILNWVFLKRPIICTQSILFDYCILMLLLNWAKKCLNFLAILVLKVLYKKKAFKKIIK